MLAQIQYRALNSNAMGTEKKSYRLPYLPIYNEDAEGQGEGKGKGKFTLGQVQIGSRDLALFFP